MALNESSSQAGGRGLRGYWLAALVFAGIMVAGFAKNYYLRTWIGTRPISFMVHVHGLIMTAWITLFFAQTVLILKHRVDLHRRLGAAGAVLAAVVVVLGIYTIASSILRTTPNIDVMQFAHLFVAFDGLSLLLFGGLVLTAIRVRLRPQVHKRLMLMAMISLLPPAFGRLVALFTRADVYLMVLGLMCVTVGICVLIDTLRHRRLHAAFALSGMLLIAINSLTCLAQAAD